MNNGGRTKFRWTMGEVVTSAADTFAANWKPLIIAQLVLMACIFGPMIFFGLSVGSVMLLLANNTHGKLLTGMSVAAISGSIIGAAVAFWMIYPACLRMVVAAARGYQPRTADLFSRPFHRALTLILSGFLMALAILGGWMLLIIPGFIVWMGLVMAHYVIVEDDASGPLEALRASWKLMRGHKLHYFGVMLLYVVASFVVGLVLKVIPFLWPVSFAFQLVSSSFGWILAATIYARIRPLPAPLSQQQQPLLIASA
jgi:hypothetical protein